MNGNRHRYPIRDSRPVWLLMIFAQIGIGVLAETVLVAQEAGAGRDESKAAVATEQPRKELCTGKVVLVQAALKRRGVVVREEMANQAVLETAGGELIPIAADWRGRAFFQDARLRDRKIELVGFRKPGIPYLQIILVYVFDEHGARMEADYWCDTCAIPMYELKPCDCCQQPIVLRLRPAARPDDVPESMNKK